MFGLEKGKNKLWYCHASNKQMADSTDDSIPVIFPILIPAPDKKTAERYADMLCGGDGYHGFVEEISRSLLFGTNASGKDNSGVQRSNGKQQEGRS